ncbi:hypothetical protein [Salipiger mucosus]|uniref:Uncharacterized protein n=1 Tax=Salipiger mucosus DSM 16094 TaxID=1123237 RepID=S9QUP5_9RHOB|nr:hypothetical protein [Salipiger mucosus]EPX83358.1 hypothetical protein Salmuc_01020 [Salipiger mucosus DSM 16094]
MSDDRSQIGTIRYNAAEERFEALVTLRTETGRTRVPSHFDAPITTGEEIAAQGLLANAQRMRDRPGGLQSHLPARAGDVAQAPTPEKHGLVPGWLKMLGGRAA